MYKGLLPDDIYYENIIKLREFVFTELNDIYKKKYNEEPSKLPIYIK